MDLCDSNRYDRVTENIYAQYSDVTMPLASDSAYSYDSHSLLCESFVSIKVKKIDYQWKFLGHQ